MAEAIPATALADTAKVEWQWGVKIPLRDGVRLNATLYKPAGLKEPRPCLFTLTPYVGDRNHDRGMYFAAHGYPFLIVDVRGRGNSEGSFRPLIQEAKDGYDVVEWLAKQPYCNGKISMSGGLYADTINGLRHRVPTASGDHRASRRWSRSRFRGAQQRVSAYDMRG
jgi:predicted acyl esterase